MTLSFLVGCSTSSNNTSNTSAQESNDQTALQQEETEKTEESAADQAEPNETQTKEKFNIGIIQIAEHPALDESRRGFEEGLAELGVQFSSDYQNAQGDPNNLKPISQRFIGENVDLILAIATNSAQTVANDTKDIPILGTAITDFVDAKLVNSSENPGTNVSGSSDIAPIKKQMDLLVQLVPDVKKVGMIYATSESNSLIQVEQAKAELESRGIEVSIGTIDKVADLSQTAQNVCKDVQAIYIPTDNVVASSIASLIAVTEPLKIPVIGGEENQVQNGATATIGINYYELGKLVAAMAKDILVNGKDISTMPIQILEEHDLVVNQKGLDAIGMELPEELKGQVKTFY